MRLSVRIKFKAASAILDLLCSSLVRLMLPSVVKRAGRIATAKLGHGKIASNVFCSLQKVPPALLVVASVVIIPTNFLANVLESIGN